MRKLAIGVGILLVLFVVAAIAIPMFYDVDKKLKPIIISAIEENTNAKAEVGQLKLSLWTGIAVKISGVKIYEASQPAPAIFEVKNAELKVSFLSLLTGKFVATFAAESPQIFVHKNEKGEMNVLRIVKKSTQTAGAEAQKNKGEKPSIGALSGKIDISILINKADLIYKDDKAKQVAKITDLTLSLKHIGIASEMQILLESNLDVKNPMAELQGPIRVTGTARFESEPMKLQLQTKADLENLSLKAMNMVEKAPKVPLSIDVDLVATENDLEVKKADLVVNDFRIHTMGKVLLVEPMSLDYKIESNELDFKNWQSIVGPLKQFNFQGKFSLQMAIKGPISDINYNGTLKLSDASLALAALAQPVTNLKANVQIAKDSVQLSDTALKIGASDLSISGTVKNFSAPIIDIKAQSNLLDLDQMMGDEKSKAEAEQAIKKQENISPEERDRKLEAMAKGPIHALKSNEMMRKLQFTASANIKKLVMKKASITDMSAVMEFKNLVLTLKQAKLKVFEGNVNANTKIDLNPEDPSYQLGGDVTGLDLNQAVESQMPALKDTITGKTFAKFEIAGQGVTVAKAKQFLTGKGNMKIENGTWSGLSVIKQISEKLEKIPSVKDQAAKIKIGNRFKAFNTNFNIAKGFFNIENATMELEEAGTAMNAKGWVNFDQQCNINAQILAPASGDLPADLKAKDGRMSLALDMDGPVKSPNVKWDKLAQQVGGAYLKHEGTKAIKKGVEQLKQNPDVQKALDKAPEKVKDLLKGIGF